MTSPPPTTFPPIVKTYQEKTPVIPDIETELKPLLYHGPGIKDREMPSCPKIDLPPKKYRPRKTLKKKTTCVPKNDTEAINVKVITVEEAKKMLATDKNFSRVTSPNIPSSNSSTELSSSSSDDEKIVLHVDRNEKAIIDKLSRMYALKSKMKKTSSSSKKSEKSKRVSHIPPQSSTSKINAGVQLKDLKSKNSSSVSKTLLSCDDKKTVPLIPKDVKVCKSDAKLITKHLRVCLKKIQVQSPVLLSEIPGYIKQEVTESNTGLTKETVASFENDTIIKVKYYNKYLINVQFVHLKILLLLYSQQFKGQFFLFFITLSRQILIPTHLMTHL